jgi:hypothetical protein
MRASQTTFQTPLFLPLADGHTPQARSNNRGHLFERFIARVFEAHGCKPPSQSSVNVSSNGYELDIVTALELTGDRAIAECKAYSSNVAAEALNKFYGKLATERLDGSIVHGWFVALPGLTSEGYQLAKKIESKDQRFRLFDADAIYRLLVDKSWITPQAPAWAHSDLAVVLSQHGLFLAAKRLDESSRLPVAVHLWSSSAGKPPDVVRRLLAESDYAVDLEVSVDDEDLGVSATAVHAELTQQLVPVSGSSDDFEYQYPASPKFFIGRRELVEGVGAFLAKTSTGSVVVLNAQSGWGKSSFALKLGGMVEKIGGVSLILDSRTASSPSYVWAAIHDVVKKAVLKGSTTLAEDASFGSLRSCIETLRAMHVSNRVPLLLFFDQFENVFRDTRLTQEFRDLALAIRDVGHPVVIGFAWKTDLVGWTEKYPYQLRDEIRSIAQVFHIDPFGPAELGTILSRLAKAAGFALSSDLRQRLREYSQGLPWLIKKLASHVLSELRAGSSEESLIADSLSIQRLFQRDLAGLNPREEAVLRQVAKDAPVAVSDILERVSPEVVQSLVDQRLVVRVGERLDTYWDTFRDFLVLGRVNVADTYILRQNPVWTSRLLRLVVENRQGVSAVAATKALRTSVNAIFNSARDLRQLGLIVSREGVYTLGSNLTYGQVTEEHLRERVASALRRHRLYQVVAEHTRRMGRPFPIQDIALELAGMFPAVQAEQRTWITYARAFARWFSYANLFELRGQELSPPGGRSTISLLLGSGGGRQKTFPQGRPTLPLALLAAMCGLRKAPRMKKSNQDKADNDLTVLGLVLDGRPTAEATKLFDRTGTLRAAALARIIASQPATAEAIAKLKAQPDLGAAEVGEILRKSQGTGWAKTTIAHAGALFRAWAKAAGIAIETPRRSVKRNTSKAAQQGVAPARRGRTRAPARR